MKVKGEGTMKKRMYGLLLVGLFCLPFWAFAAAGRIVYDGAWGDAYAQALQQGGVRGVSFAGQTKGLAEALTRKDVLAVELYDIQAQALAENTQQQLYWYPQYKMNIVLAVSPACPYPVTGWQSLLSQPVTVCLNLSQPFLTYAILAFSYGLNQDFSGHAALSALQTIEKEGRLRTDTTGTPASYLHRQERQAADVYILPDYAVRQLQQRGEALRLVQPQEGTLVFTKGLAAYQPLDLDQEALQPSLAAAGYGQAEAVKALPLAREAPALGQSADLSRLLRRDVFHVYKLNTLLPLNHVQCYLLLLLVIVFLGLSLCRCMLQKEARQACLVVIAVLLLGVFIRLGALLTYADAWVRWLWYGYYLFFSLLITAIIWLCEAAGRDIAAKRHPAWLKGVAVYNLLLGLLVLANDYHQWAFTFPPGTTDAATFHGYGPLYYLLLASFGGEFIAANLRLYYASWRQKVLRPNLAWSLVCVAVFALYIFGYLCQWPFMWFSELILTVAVLTLLWLVFLVQARILPANVGYKNFFTYSDLAMEIKDDRGNVMLRSHNAETLPQTASVEKQTMPIRSGFVTWYRDVHELQQRQQELTRKTETLQRLYTWLRRDEETKRKLIDQEVSREIYQHLRQLVAEKRQHIRQCIQRLQQAEGESGRRQAVKELKILACYIKKRCVLFLRSRESGGIPAAELALAFRESLVYFQQAGLTGSVNFRLQGPLTAEVLELYDCWEEIGKRALHQGEAYMLATVSEEKDGYCLRLVLENTPQTEYLHDFPPFLSLVQRQQKQLEYGWRLSFRVGKEQKNG